MRLLDNTARMSDITGQAISRNLLLRQSNPDELVVSQLLVNYQFLLHPLDKEI